MNKSELKKILTDMYIGEDSKKLAEHNRSLPFAESVLDDRWERAGRLGFGEGSSVYNSALVFGDVHVGKNTWIGPNVILDGSGGRLEIGSHCSIAAGVHIYTHDSVLWAVSGGKAPYNKGSIIVGDNSYIGAQSILMPSVEVGSQVVIAANSTVKQSTGDRAIYAGNPAKKIGWISTENDKISFFYD